RTFSRVARACGARSGSPGVPRQKYGTNESGADRMTRRHSSKLGLTATSGASTVPSATSPMSCAESIGAPSMGHRLASSTTKPQADQEASPQHARDQERPDCSVRERGTGPHARIPQHDDVGPCRGWRTLADQRALRCDHRLTDGNASTKLRIESVEERTLVIVPDLAERADDRRGAPGEEATGQTEHALSDPERAHRGIAG